MTNFVMVHDLVEANGKTVKENNLTIPHDIPIGTLVEIDYAGSEYHGVRLFIASYGRDCDGEPLYSLTHDRNFCDDFIKREWEAGPPRDEEEIRDCRLRYQHGGWGKNSLIIVTDKGLADAEARGYQEAVDEIVQMAKVSTHLVHPIFIPAIEGLPQTRDINKKG